MRAGVFRGNKHIVVEDVPDPQPSPDGVVLRVSACGICGSDLHSYTHGSWIQPGQIMGHEFSGEVVEVGGEVEGIAEGDRVTALPLVACGRCPRCLEGSSHLCETGLAASIAYGLPGAFAEYLHVPKAVLGGSVFRLPDEVSSTEAALVEPLSVAVHAVKSTSPKPSDVAVVLGLGSIGQNVAQALKALGAAKVIGIDVAPRRLETAAQLGTDVVVHGRDTDPLEAVREIVGPGAYGVGARADIVIETSGVPALLNQAVQMVRPGGTVRVVALYDEPVSLDVNAIVQKELDFRGSFGYRGEFPEAIELIRSGRVRVAPLVTHTFPLERIGEAFEAQMSKDESVKVVVQP